MANLIPEPKEAGVFLAHLQSLASAAEEKKRVTKLAALSVKVAAQDIMTGWATDGCTSETVDELRQHVQNDARIVALGLSLEHLSEALERFLDELAAAGVTVGGSGKGRYIYWGAAQPRKG